MIPRLVNGGYLDVTVSSNGDTDGIDSNGTFTQTCGICITRGSGVSSHNLSLHSSDNHTISINRELLTFNNAYSYGRTYCYSSYTVTLG